jgi:pentatricopeptide repeat protein
MFGTLMTACEQTTDLNAMYNVFHLMDHVHKIPPNHVVYGAAMSCCRKSGNAKATYQLYQHMLQQQDDDNDDDDELEISMTTLNTVLAAMVGNHNNHATIVKGDLDQALEMVIAPRNTTTSTLSLFSEKETTTPNWQTYGILIRAMASHGCPQDAEQLLQDMNQTMKLVPDVDLYTAMVASYK